MRRLLGLVLLVALLVAACGGDGDGDAAATTTPTTGVPTDDPAGDAPEGAGDDEGLGDVLLAADLTPEAEVPGPGATGARGRFEAELVDGELCVDMVVSDLGDAVLAAHMHEGAAGAAGPPLVDLGEPTELSATGERWVDACTPVSDDIIARLAAGPDQHYVNVHTPSFPDGAVRGQLVVASVFDRTLD